MSKYFSLYRLLLKHLHYTIESSGALTVKWDSCLQISVGMPVPGTAQRRESMESQFQPQSLHKMQTDSTPEFSPEFSKGTAVVYGMHGKCCITGIETRLIQGTNVPFYKLELHKSTLSRSKKKEPEIWVPVGAARERGLRLPISQEEAKAVLEILGNREYYFPITDSWSTVQHKLEVCIRAEGAVGFAKVISYLYVLKRKQIVPTPEVTRMFESISKPMLRELSEALSETLKTLEERIHKLLRVKLTHDM